MVIQKNITVKVLSELGIKIQQKFKLYDGFTGKYYGIFYFGSNLTLWKCYSDKFDEDYSAVSKSCEYLLYILNGTHLLEIKDS